MTLQLYKSKHLNIIIPSHMYISCMHYINLVHTMQCKQHAPKFTKVVILYIYAQWFLKPSHTQNKLWRCKEIKSSAYIVMPYVTIHMELYTEGNQYIITIIDSILFILYEIVNIYIPQRLHLYQACLACCPNFTGYKLHLEWIYPCRPVTNYVPSWLNSTSNNCQITQWSQLNNSDITNWKL